MRTDTCNGLRMTGPTSPVSLLFVIFLGLTPSLTPSLPPQTPSRWGADKIDRRPIMRERCICGPKCSFRASSTFSVDMMGKGDFGSACISRAVFGVPPNTFRPAFFLSGANPKNNRERL